MVGMRRLRVMHVVVGGDIGGAERVVVDLATRPEVTGAEHQVALITPNRALAAYFANASVRVHDRGPSRENPLAYLYRSFGPADVAWLAGLLGSEAIDIVHTHTFGSHVLGTRAARRAGRPQLRTEHHVMHYFDRSSSPFTRWAAARTERFVAVSEYVRRVLVEAAPLLAGRMTVVRNGVDTEHFRPRERPEGEFCLGIVCRLTAWKRVHLAIEAAALSGVELVVIGDGEERTRLEALAIERGARARFVGYQSDPRPFVAGCDAIVSASDAEPLGLSVLEALAMGRPVIAYAAGGIPEIVETEVTGLLVSEPTAAAMASAIDRARRDRPALARMGASGRSFAVEQGTVDRMCQGYAAAYAAVATVP
jgi:glycosyltransferase involved in cell wall biosynthesis